MNCCGETVKLGTRPKGGSERSAASANKLGTRPKGGTERSTASANQMAFLDPKSPYLPTSFQLISTIWFLPPSAYDSPQDVVILTH
jgi:hypothetical protein